MLVWILGYFAVKVQNAFFYLLIIQDHCFKIVEVHEESGIY